MPAPTFQEELAVYGPTTRHTAPPLAAALAYCRRLARSHYENFSVASLLLPASLRQHFYNVYAYCRWADDLADETASAPEALDLLSWWESELLRCYAGEATHPVFVALRSTIDEFAIPREPFQDLLVAFRQDQTQQRYGTFDELLDYCRYSANPVGRIVLYLGRCPTPQHFALSDSLCTGLQLANHWQDVARDYAKGRVYLPQEDLERFGVAEQALGARYASESFRGLLQFEVERAAQLLHDGAPLCREVAAPLRLQVTLFLHGGLAILDEIRRANYDVLARRPTVSRWRKVRLLAGAWLARGKRS